MTPLGRAVRARRIEIEGWTARAVAVGDRTVRKWLARYRAEGVSGLGDRSGRAPAVASRLAAPCVATALRLRDFRLRGAELAAGLNLARTTVAGQLAATGLARLQALDPQPPVVRYQRERPGELVHLDV